MTANIIFDVSLDAEFTQNTRFIADGHMFDAPPSMMHESVLSGDSAWIVLMMAYIN